MFPTPIRTRRRAAVWCTACSAPSTASTRSSSKGSRRSQIRGYVIESLLARGYDEPFTLYGLLAQTVETDDARSYVTFTLNPGREIFRRQAGHRRGCDLLVAAPARPRPAELPHLLRQGRQGRSARSDARCASIFPAPTTASCR